MKLYGGENEAGERFERVLDDRRGGIGRAEDRVEHMTAVWMDTGAAVRACDHAEDDARLVAAADIVRIGMRAVAPHAVKRQLRVRREDGQRAVDAVDVVCAGQDERRKLEQERHRRHRVLFREGTALEHHGLELLHDRIGLFELAEKAEIGVFTEHGLAVVIRVSLAERRELAFDERMKRGFAAALRRIIYLENAERDAARSKALVLADVKHGTLSFLTSLARKTGRAADRWSDDRRSCR